MKKLIQRIMLWLGSWPKDKVLHFTICLIISLLSGCIARICGAEWTGVMAAAWFGQAYTRGMEMAADWLVRLKGAQ